ncbi:hypothetical protein [uncultured Sphingomonas sp.]|uniref:hypothetical protein n=1 Tax=uncultured Sphingomonas sp. TaxID=158754 RepID=UPI0025D888C9|nr:hypothetical protein [uncultured Sphingomonas sp.]
MAMTRAEHTGVAAAALIALATPALLLGIGREPMPATPATPALLAVRPAVAGSKVYTRDLFGNGGSDLIEDTPAPDDAPQLAGIVGRIGADAVAMVRTADGRTRTIAVGEGVDGWTLESLAIDAAYFTRGGQKARVPLPAGE